MIKFVIGLIVRIWLWLVSWLRRTPKPLRTIHLGELPEQLEVGDVYVMGEGQHKWFVALACPCGCGGTVQVSLLTDARPQWRLTTHADGTISLVPSVWRKVGCRSHFFLRRGLIVWA